MYAARRLPALRRVYAGPCLSSRVVPPHGTLLYSTPSSPSFHTNNSLESSRKANLGSMIDYLREIVPEALRVVPETERLDKDIVLRVSPSITPSVPLIKGTVSYITALKATQLIFTSFVLGHVKLHITDLKVDEEGVTQYGLYKGATKVIVKWTTCGDDCEHLIINHKVQKVDESKHSEWRNILKALNIGGGENSDEHVHRIMSGVFVFELTKENDKILVHNVENVEMLDKKDLVNKLGGNLAAG